MLSHQKYVPLGNLKNSEENREVREVSLHPLLSSCRLLQFTLSLKTAALHSACTLLRHNCRSCTGRLYFVTPLRCSIYWVTMQTTLLTTAAYTGSPCRQHFFQLQRILGHHADNTNYKCSVYWVTTIQTTLFTNATYIGSPCRQHFLQMQHILGHHAYNTSYKVFYTLS